MTNPNPIDHEAMRAELIAKANADAEFRRRLVADPKGAIKDALGLEVPDAMNVHVHEDTATTSHFVLPPSPELSADDLEAVAGTDVRHGMYGVNYKHAHDRGNGVYEIHGG